MNEYIHVLYIHESNLIIRISESNVTEINCSLLSGHLMPLFIDMFSLIFYMWNKLPTEV